MGLTAADFLPAWQLVKRGSQISGVDAITPELFRGIADEQLEQLAEQINQQQYSPLPALGFFIRRKGQAKRLVGIAAVRDRIVQRYLLQHMTPALDAIASPCSYAYRVGHSVPAAVQHLLAYYAGQSAWLLQSDIHQFFDSLCWSVLTTQLEQLPLPGYKRHCIEQQIRVDLVVRGHRWPRHQGVMQGSALSGALANLYLTEFDHRCLQSGIQLVRYGDDLAAVCQSEAVAKRTLHQMEAWLNGYYLSLNPSKTRISAPDEEVVFLGHRIQQGRVIATLKDWHPYQRRKAKPRLQRPVQRPRQCGVVQTVSQLSQPPVNHYWSPDMTTLYVTDQGAKLRAVQGQFQVFSGSQLLCQVPVNQVSQVVLFGCCNVSHGAAQVALYRRIPVVYLSQKGRYYGRLETAGMAEVEYLAEQVQRSADPEFSYRMAETLVMGKLHNSRTVLQRLNRRHESVQAVEAIDAIAKLMDSLSQAESLDALRGYEGQGAKVYFRGLASLFAEPFQFESRTIRPPKDPVNSLLSLGYTLLHHNLFSFVMALGLHTHFGHLHTPRKHHPALVMDLVEEFRAPIVDSFVAYLINCQIIKPEDFTPPDERGGVYLYPDALKVFLKHWEDRMHKEVTHPHTGYKVPYRRCLELQVREYIACLTGDQEMYRPMLWKV